MRKTTTKFIAPWFLLTMVMVLALACSTTASPSPEPAATATPMIPPTPAVHVQQAERVNTTSTGETKAVKASTFTADPLGDVIPVSFKPTSSRTFAIYNVVRDGKNRELVYGNTNEKADRYLAVVEDHQDSADLYKVRPADLVDFIIDTSVGSALSSAEHTDWDTDTYIAAHPGRWFIVYPAVYGETPSLFERPLGIMIYVQEVAKKDGVDTVTVAIKRPWADTVEIETYSDNLEHPLRQVMREIVLSALDRVDPEPGDTVTVFAAYYGVLGTIIDQQAYTDSQPSKRLPTGAFQVTSYSYEPDNTYGEAVRLHVEYETTSLAEPVVYDIILGDRTMAMLDAQEKIETVLNRVVNRSFWDAAGGRFERPDDFFSGWPDDFGIFSKANLEGYAAYTIYPATVTSGAMPALSELPKAIRVSQVFDGQLDQYSYTKVTYTLVQDGDSVWLVENVKLWELAKTIFKQAIDESALAPEESFTVFYAPIEVAKKGPMATQ